MPDSAAPPAVATARPGYRRWATAAFVVGILVLSFNLRAAITSLPPLFPELSASLGLSTAAIAALAATPVLCFAAFSGVAAPAARALPRSGVTAALRGSARAAGGPGAARCWPRWPGGAAGMAALPWHRAGERRHRVDERAAAEPGQAAPPGQGWAADWDLPAQSGGGGDPRLADSGAGVPGVRWIGPAGPGAMGPAGGSGGAGVAAAMALPDGAGRSPAAQAAAVAEGVQIPPGLAGHGVYGLAKPDLLRNALLAADVVPGQGSGRRSRGHAARGDESR